MRSAISDLALFASIAVLFAGCSDPAAEFCAIAETSSVDRSQGEIEDYYQQLHSVAPEEVLEATTTLRDRWNAGSMPITGLTSGGEMSVDMSGFNRPAEVSEAARTITGFYREDGAVVLAIPDRPAPNGAKLG